MSISKKIAASVYERVWVAKKSTIAGLALVAADAVVSVLQAEPLPSWAHAIVGLAAACLVAYRKRQEPPPVVAIPLQPPPAAVFAAILLVALSGCALFQRPQTTTLTTGPDGGCIESTEWIKVGDRECRSACIKIPDGGFAANIDCRKIGTGITRSMIVPSK